MPPHRLLAGAHEAADRGRRDTEMRDLVAFDHRPHARCVGEVRRPVVRDDRRAEHQPAGDEPRAHHPTDVGHPEDDVAVLQIEAVGHVLRGLDREPAVHVHRALRLTCRARRVDDHERILGRGVLGRPRRRVARDDVRPSHFTWSRRVRARHAFGDDDVLDARDGRDRGVGGLLHRHDLAAAEKSVRTDERDRVAVAQASGDRIRCVAGKDRDVHGAEVPDREDRNDAVVRHRHEDADAVALPETESREPAREGLHVGAQLAVRHAANRAFLAFGDDGDAIRAETRAQGGVHVVDASAGPPRRPRDAARVVEHAVVALRPHEIEVAVHGAPETVEVGLRPAQQAWVVGMSVRLRERAEAAAIQIRGARRPGWHRRNANATTCARSLPDGRAAIGIDEPVEMQPDRA